MRALLGTASHFCEVVVLKSAKWNTDSQVTVRVRVLFETDLVLATARLSEALLNGTLERVLPPPTTYIYVFTYVCVYVYTYIYTYTYIYIYMYMHRWGLGFRVYPDSPWTPPTHSLQPTPAFLTAART